MVDLGGDHFILKVLGAPSIAKLNGDQIRGLGPGKPLAMLTYLAVRREARRDELIELLWGGMPDAKARNAFRQALHRLRLALGEAMIPQDRDSVRIGTPDLIATDRDEFLAACESDAAAQAITLYRGDFLDGFEVGESSFDRWCDSERTRLRSRFEAVLRDGATRKLQAGEWVEALQMAERLAVLAPFDGTAAELEATVLVAAGRPTEALGTLGRYVTRIKEELDIPPTPGVREFLVRLERNAGKPGGAASAARDAKPSRPRIPFVGREVELTQLVALVRELEHERGSCVVVRGETGIGKTRVVDELLERVQPLGPLLVLRGRERAGGAAVPYAGVADALRSIVHAPGVAGASRHLLSEVARILPEFRDAFKLDPPGSIEQEGGRLRFFEGIAAVLDAVAYETPVLVVLDDLQHTSASTLDLLTYLSGRLEHSPVLFVLVYRSDGASPQVHERLDALSRAPGAASTDEPASGLIDLAPFSTSQIESLVLGYAAQRGADPRIDAARIAQSAGGRPMRALDLARRALHGSPGNDSPVRPRDILWARLQSASPSQRRVFFAAALLERSATLRLLAAAAHLPESAALDAAAELERAGLLSQFGSGFGLTHDATAGFVVEVSGVAGRALLAGWAADALAEEGDGTDAELAHLYSLAGRTTPAFRHARVAAYAAAAAGATSEALRLFGVAHTFAPDTGARIEIEEALRAFGDAQRLMLPAGSENRVDLPLTGTHASDPAVESEPRHRDPTSETDRSSRQQASIDGADAASAGAVEAEAGKGRKLGMPRAQAAPALRPVFWLALLFATVVASFAIRRQLQRAQPARVLVDSLLVVERSHDRDSVAQVVTGPQFRGTTVFRGSTRRIREPAWADSTAIPWINPNPSPSGIRVAEERVSGRGTDLYVIGPSRQDTAVVALGGGQNVALGWSPDGRWLLVSRARTLPDGTFDSDLFRYGVETRTLLPIDTSADRSVSEAVWAPDGLHVAWVASVGTKHQRDIFVSDPDGSDLRHVVDSPADDYDIAWSPDATLLGFTSTRNGEQHVYAYDFGEAKVRQLTFGTGIDDRLQFSPDGRTAAFQSNRDGEWGVYVMAALGGAPVRVTPTGHWYAIVGWRGRPIPYLDRLRIVGSTTVPVGDTATFTLLALDQGGLPIGGFVPRWTLADAGAVRAVSADSSGAPRYRLIATRPGSARLAVSTAGWRMDSIVISAGTGRFVLADDDFSRGLDARQWVPLGDPRPSVGTSPDGSGGRALFLNAGLGFGSGILSTGTVALRPGLVVEARLFAPFNAAALLPGQVEVALVASVGDPSPGERPSQFTRLLDVSWSGQTGRMQYAIGTVTDEESAAGLGGNGSHLIRIAVGSGDSVTFSVDGVARWRSSLGSLGDPAGLGLVRLWIGGVNTAGWRGAVGRISASLSNEPP